MSTNTRPVSRRFVLFGLEKQAILSTGVEFPGGQVVFDSDGPLDLRETMPPLGDNVELVYLDASTPVRDQDVASVIIAARQAETGARVAA